MNIQEKIAEINANGITLIATDKHIKYTPKSFMTRQTALWLIENKKAVIHSLQHPNTPPLIKEVKIATNISIDTMTNGKLTYAEFRRVTDAVEDINIKEPHRIKETETFIDWLDSCGIGWFNEFE